VDPEALYTVGCRSPNQGMEMVHVGVDVAV
jgi:hypothetical protein